MPLSLASRWLRALSRSWFGSSPRPRPERRRVRLQLEALEDRLTPSSATQMGSTLLVTLTGAGDTAGFFDSNDFNTLNFDGGNDPGGQFTNIKAITVTGDGSTGQQVFFTDNAGANGDTQISLTGDLAISGVQTVNFEGGTTGDLSLGSLTEAGATKGVLLNDGGTFGIVATAGGITFNDPVIVGAAHVELNTQNGSGNVTFNSTVDAQTAGADSLTVDGGGTTNVLFGGAVGTTTASLGALLVGDITTTFDGAVSASSLTNNGLTTINASSIVTTGATGQYYGGNVTLSQSTTLDASAGGGSINILGNVTNNAASGTVTLGIKDGGGASDIADSIISDGPTAKTALTLESGTLMLDQGTYTGATTIDAGTTLVEQSTLSTSTMVVLDGTLTLDANNVLTVSIGALTGASTGVVQTPIGNGLAVNGTGTFGGAIEGSTHLTLVSGTLTLTGDNTYTGDTDIMGGTLALTGRGSITDSGQSGSMGVAVGAQSTFDISGTTAGAFVLALTPGGGVINVGAQTLTVGADVTFASGSTFSAALTTVSGGTIASGELSDSGSVNLGGATLDLTTTTTYSAGNSATIVASPMITGNFNPASSITVGGNNFTIANSGSAIVLTVGGVPVSSFTITSSPASPTAGESFTLTATVSAAGVMPTGTVTFFEDGNMIGTVALGSSATASDRQNLSPADSSTMMASASLIVSAGFTQGTHSVIASYSGGNTVIPASTNGNPLMITVGPSSGGGGGGGGGSGTTTTSVFATGPDAGGGPDVTIFNGNGVQLAKVRPYDDGALNGTADVFTGGVHVGVGDLTGNGNPDVVCTPGGGGGPDVKVFDTAGDLIAHIQPVIDGYAPLMFFGGLNVACGDVLNNGRDQIIITTDSLVSEVLVFDYAGTTDPTTGLLKFNLIDSFIPFGTASSPFGGGARVAVADVTGSGVGDIVVAAGPGGGPDVKSYQADGTPIQEFKAGPDTYNFGLYVGAGYLNGLGAGKADIVVGTGSGAGAAISVFSATAQGEGAAPLYSTGSMGVSFPDSSFTGGVRLAVVDPSGQGDGEIVSTLGPGGDPHVHILNGQTLVEINSLTPVDPGFTGGLFISANG